MTLLDPTGRPADAGEAPQGAPIAKRDNWLAGKWDARLWSDLARLIGLEPEQPLLLALSGGADSVFLLHAMACAQPRPNVLVVHVDHGLRGQESAADADFCRRQVQALGLPFIHEKVELGSGTGSLEARARTARYTALGRFAAADGRCVLTAHHADDALETLLWRWTRGSEGPGLRAAPGLAPLPHAPANANKLRVARPLRHLRRAELRAWLDTRGLSWREDSSNVSAVHTRNRIRHGLLPLLGEHAGPDALHNLEAFGRATEALEQRLAQGTANLGWEPLIGAEPHDDQAAPLQTGGCLARAHLALLPRPLRRRALWRLFLEGTGRAPGRRLLETILDDLEGGRATRHTLPGGASLHLRSDVLVLESEQETASQTDPGTEPELGIRVGQACRLPDGRTLRLEQGHRGPLEASANLIEIASQALPDDLIVRRALPGDRFHALGAPGSKRLVRFLADRGVPRGLRARAWVLADAPSGELLAVIGHGPAERLRVQDCSLERHRLGLEGLHGQPACAGFWPSDLVAGPAASQRRLPGRRGRDT